MNTSQNFFYNIVNNNASTFSVLNNTIGDYDKNTGLVANLYELSCNILGNTVSDNLDLDLIFGQNILEFQSDQSDTLNQSLRNSTIGIAYSNFYSSPIDVSTHISTNLFNYTAQISSTFLSGQIYSFNTTGISTNSNIIIPASSINYSGTLNKSWLLDVPMDLAIYGINSFSGVYSGSGLIKFDYGWSFCNNSTNLIINLGFTTIKSSKLYFAVYWGNSDSGFINTSNLVLNGNVYSGTNTFIQNISLSTQNLISPTGFNTFTTRKNFWSTSYPYSVTFQQKGFVDIATYLHTPNRLNYTLVDGIGQTYQSSNVFSLNGSFVFSGINTNFTYLYFDSATSGGVNANFNLGRSYSSYFRQNVNLQDLKNTNLNNVPLAYAELQYDPKKVGSNINYFTLSSFNQIIPSAFTKNIFDINLWKYFVPALINSKNAYVPYSNLTKEFLSTLDNFFAAYLFGYQYTDVTSFFSGSSLLTSEYALKLFTKPYSYYNTPSLNFNSDQEYALYSGTNIVSSKDFFTFNEGKITVNRNYNLPSDTGFELFKPVSYVCNGIDPFLQGQGLALDYTLNILFTYNNQNILQKTLYLMASKYLLSENDYNNRLAANKDVTGYYYYVDPVNTQANTNSYSVSSINEFYLYGYSGYIPDLKDGIIRPILTRQFSPKDGNKYTYDEYVALLKAQNPSITQDQINDSVQNYLDNGGEFYTVDTNSFSANFNNITDLSLCATNYINTFEQNKYWNDQFSNVSSLGNNGGDYGFTKFTAQNLAGYLNESVTTINNVSVGYNCVVNSVSPLTAGSNQIPGTYKEFVLPSVLSSGIFTTEQPAVITYTINSNGVLNSSSLKLASVGANFYYDFVYTLQCGINAGGVRATISVKMDNTFNCTASFNISGGKSYLTSLVQSSAPSYGYNVGFYLNQNVFNSLGYTPNGITGKLLISDSPTVDSFLIASSGQAVGSLENFNNYNYITTDFSGINFTSGSDIFYLYDKEIINALVVPSSLQGQTISNISLQCKLINLIGYVPSGFFKVIIYKPDANNQPNLNDIAAISDGIDVTHISNSAFSQITVPISFKFYNSASQSSNSLLFFSVQQSINSAFLAIKGSFSGISTSSFNISTSQIQNNNSNLIIYGGISTSYGSDLDSVYPIRFDILQGITAQQINSANVYLRRDAAFTSTNNLVYLVINAGQNSYQSSPINFNSIGYNFTGIGFTFSSNIATSQIVYSTLNFDTKIQSNQIYLSRDLSKYDYSLGIGSTSILNNNNTLVNFDFTFNKLFSGVSNEIFGAFNYTDQSQFGLAKPNTKRVLSPINIVDGYWAFKTKNINQPLSIYPRAYLSYSNVINSGSPTYVYLGYTHDIYVALGYNYLGITSIETIKLPARPSWKTTWMTRDTSNYKNFDIFNVFIQSYFNSIAYVQGTASTLIGSNGTPKNAIFEGTFNPGQTNQSLPISVQIGTSAGVQVYINNSSSPVIDTFSVVSSGSTTLSYSISTAVRQSSIYFKVLYYTLGTAAITLGWNTTYPYGMSTYISSSSSYPVNNQPVSLNQGKPIDDLIFFNVSKVDTNSQVNFGFPPGDSFIIRSS